MMRIRTCLGAILDVFDSNLGPFDFRYTRLRIRKILGTGTDLLICISVLDRDPICRSCPYAPFDDKLHVFHSRKQHKFIRIFSDLPVYTVRYCALH
jgi:hypothetical protein